LRVKQASVSGVPYFDAARVMKDLKDYSMVRIWQVLAQAGHAPETAV
jgi:hypothetical protein